MKIVDLNVLLYAVNQNDPQHAAVADWWRRALNGDEGIGLPWVVLLGFLRLATNRRIFAQPLPLAVALDKVRAWLELPIVHVPKEKPEHFHILSELLSAQGMAGHLTTDAHLAALAINADATLISCDRDFARFSGLRYRHPVQTAGRK